MLHRDSREIVNTGDHLTTLKGETSCSGWDLGRAHRAPNQYCTTCANVPELILGVSGGGLVCNDLWLLVFGEITRELGRVIGWELRSVGMQWYMDRWMLRLATATTPADAERS